MTRPPTTVAAWAAAAAPPPAPSPTCKPSRETGTAAPAATSSEPRLRLVDWLGAVTWAAGMDSRLNMHHHACMPSACSPPLSPPLLNAVQLL